VSVGKTLADRSSGLVRTPVVVDNCAIDVSCASGRLRPTHFSLTHSGASPGGTDVILST
jgi:hypothetical protein